MENDAPTTPPVTPPADASATELATLKAQLATTATSVLAGVPEALRGLIPANLPPADQIAWFHSAKATGVFDAKPTVPATDSGKPAITPTTTDPASLPAFARMSAGYRTK